MSNADRTLGSPRLKKFYEELDLLGGKVLGLKGQIDAEEQGLAAIAVEGAGINPVKESFGKFEGRYEIGSWVCRDPRNTLKVCIQVDLGGDEICLFCGQPEERK